MPTITEAEIAKVVVTYLTEKTTREATIAELIKEIPNRVRLSEDDLRRSQTRPNEAIWEQKVRNITSHKDSPGNAIYEGKLIATAGGLALPHKSAAA